MDTCQYRNYVLHHHGSGRQMIEAYGWAVDGHQNVDRAGSNIDADPVDSDVQQP